MLNSHVEDDHLEAVLDNWFDEPHDEIVARQELEDFEQVDEYFGLYGSDDSWD